MTSVGQPLRWRCGAINRRPNETHLTLINMTRFSGLNIVGNVCDNVRTLVIIYIIMRKCCILNLFKAVGASWSQQGKVVFYWFVVCSNVMRFQCRFTHMDILAINHSHVTTLLTGKTCSVALSSVAAHMVYLLKWAKTRRSFIDYIN